MAERWDKHDWARRQAEKFVADGRPMWGYHKTEDEERDIKRLAALLRRTYKKVLSAGSTIGKKGLAWV